MYIPTLLGFLTIAKATGLDDFAPGVVAPGVVSAVVEPSDIVVVVPRHDFKIPCHHFTVRSKLFLLLEGGFTWSSQP